MLPPTSNPVYCVPSLLVGLNGMKALVNLVAAYLKQLPALPLETNSMKSSLALQVSYCPQDMALIIVRGRR